MSLKILLLPKMPEGSYFARYDPPRASGLPQYQRQLWDPDCIQGGPATYRSTQAQRRSQALFDAVQKRKQTEALAASGKAKGSKTGEDDEEDDELALEETDPPHRSITFISLAMLECSLLTCVEESSLKKEARHWTIPSSQTSSGNFWKRRFDQVACAPLSL